MRCCSFVVVHCDLYTNHIHWTVSQQFPHFAFQGSISQKNRKLLRPKANVKIKTCWIVAQFLAPKPVQVALLTDSFIVLFQNYWNFNLNCKHGKHKTAFGTWKVTGTFKKQALEIIMWTNIALKQNAHHLCDKLP